MSRKRLGLLVSKKVQLLLIVIILVIPVEIVMGLVTVDGSAFLGATQINTQSALVKDSKGFLHTVYVKDYSGNDHVYVASSKDNGVTWINITRVSVGADLNTRNQINPSIFLDMYDNFHIVFHGGRTWTASSQIGYRKKIVSTGTWSAVIEVTNEGAYVHTSPVLVVYGTVPLAKIFFQSTHGGGNSKIWSRTVSSGYAVGNWKLHSEDLTGFETGGFPEKFSDALQVNPTVSMYGTGYWVLMWEGNSNLTTQASIFGEIKEDTTQERITSETFRDYSPSVTTDEDGGVYLAYQSSREGDTTNRQVHYMKVTYSKFAFRDYAYVSNSTYYDFSSYLQDPPNIAVDRYNRPHITWSGKSINHTGNSVTFHRWEEYSGVWQNITEVYMLGRSTYPNLLCSLLENEIPLVFWENYASDDVRFEILNMSYPLDYPELVNSTLVDVWENIINGNWLFKGEVYKIDAWFNNTQYGYLNFTDTIHNIRFEYDNRTGAYIVNVFSDYELVIGLISSDYIVSGGFTYVEWTFILDVNIIDSLDVPIGWYAENQYGNYTTGLIGHTVNIYNLGDIVSYVFEGDSGRTIGGHSLEVWNENSSLPTSYVDNYHVFRRLQHVHLLFSLDVEDNDCFDTHENTGYVTLGIQYLDEDNNWVDGWYCVISMVNGAVDLGGGGIGKAWIMPFISWYSRDVGGTVSLVKSDYLSGYPECGDNVAEDVTHTRFYVDLWFDKMNSSTTVGGRVSTYYFGMDEGGWMLWSDWNPVTFNHTESMFFDDLRKVDGNITTSHTIELMRFWVRVQKTNVICDTHRWSIRNPQVSYQVAGDRMESLNTPDGVETIVIDMPSAGWLQPLAKAISGISTAIWNGALSFVKLFIGAVDSFLIFLNSPVSMSQMIDFIMIQASVISTWMAFIIQRTTDILNIFTNIINVFLQYIGLTINAMLWVLTNVVGFPLQVILFLVAIINGQPYTIAGTTFDFTMGGEIIQAGLELAPYGFGFAFCFWLFFGDIYGEKQDIEGLPSRIVQVYGFGRIAFQNIFWVYTHAKNEIISMYNFIRSHIPSMGGGGGESEE